MDPNCEDCLGFGFSVFNAERGLEIERCASCNNNRSDGEAIELVTWIAQEMLQYVRFPELSPETVNHLRRARQLAEDWLEGGHISQRFVAPGTKTKEHDRPCQFRIRDSDSFVLYQQSLNVRNKQLFSHFGFPTKYPCLVSSVGDTGVGDTKTYHHSFVYPTRYICTKCGDSAFMWPVAEEFIRDF